MCFAWLLMGIRIIRCVAPLIENGESVLCCSCFLLFLFQRPLFNRTKAGWTERNILSKIQSGIQFGLRNFVQRLTHPCILVTCFQCHDFSYIFTCIPHIPHMTWAFNSMVKPGTEMAVDSFGLTQNFDTLGEGARRTLRSNKKNRTETGTLWYSTQMTHNIFSK